MNRPTVSLIALCAVWFVAIASPAFACACDIDCKPGEVYSDEAEGCVPDATS